MVFAIDCNLLIYRFICDLKVCIKSAIFTDISLRNRQKPVKNEKS